LKIIIPLIILIFFLIKFYIQSKKAKKITDKRMFSCESCGTYVTKNLAIKRGNQYFCSEDCIK